MKWLASPIGTFQVPASALAKWVSTAWKEILEAGAEHSFNRKTPTVAQSIGNISSARVNKG